MSLIPKPTAAEAAQARQVARLTKVGTAINYLNSVLTAVDADFAREPVETALAVMNANVANATAILTAQIQLATITNGMLDQLGVDAFKFRAPVVLGRTDVTFNPQTGLFVAAVVS